LGEAVARGGLPMLPRLGGVGPVLWRQLATAVRSPGRLFVLALPVAVLLAGPLSASPNQREASRQMVPLVAVCAVGMWFFFTTLMPFDFRADVDRMALLKTLPLPAWRLALGQVIAPVMVAGIYQCLLLVLLAVVLRGTEPVLLVAGVFAVPFNLVLFGLENLLFLVFPTRLHGSTPGDFEALGRSFLLLSVKTLALIAALAGATGAGLIAYLLSRYSVVVGYAGGWLALAAAGVSLVPLLGLAFERFDVTRDTPA
jgi:hypothetical protein